MRSHTVTIKEFNDATAQLARMRRAVARGLADTLLQQFPTAAYLALWWDEISGGEDVLWLHSVLDERGAVLSDFGFESAMAPLPDGPATAGLRRFWADCGESPQDEMALLGILRDLHHSGGRFAELPDDLPATEAPSGLPCLPLRPTAQLRHRFSPEDELLPFNQPPHPGVHARLRAWATRR